MERTRCLLSLLWQRQALGTTTPPPTSDPRRCAGVTPWRQILAALGTVTVDEKLGGMLDRCEEKLYTQLAELNMGELVRIATPTSRVEVNDGPVA